jgi:hypothetical protein
LQVEEGPDSLSITIQPQGPTFPTLMTSSMALAFAAFTGGALLHAALSLNILLLLFMAPFVVGRLAGCFGCMAACLPACLVSPALGRLHYPGAPGQG